MGGGNIQTLIIIVLIFCFASIGVYYGNLGHRFISEEYLRKSISSGNAIPTHRPTTIHRPSPAPSPGLWNAKHPKQTIRPTLSSKKSSPTYPTRSPFRMHSQSTELKCYITSDESCSLDSFEFGKSVTIFPSPDSGCGCIESLERYSFVVTKGSEENVLIYFQGGGLCWNYKSFKEEKCRTYINLPPDIGILDHNQSNSMNPFNNFTIITIPYCSGDFFLGNSTDNYFDSTGKTIRYRGAIDAYYILQWLRNEHLSGKYLSYPLQKLIITGSSAGSIGALYWSTQYSKYIFAKTTSVISDSMILYTSAINDGILYKKWNICMTPIFISLNISCNHLQNLHHLDLLKIIISYNSYLTYFFITSKYDWTAWSYYNDITVSLSHFSYLSTGNVSTSEYYQFIRLFIFKMIKTNHLTNIFFYLINSYHHIYLNRENMFLATPISEIGLQHLNNSTTIGLPLYQWLEIIVTHDRNYSSICQGDDCDTSIFKITN